MSTATAGGGPASGPAPTPGDPPVTPSRSVLGTRPWVAACFLLPALALLGALVVYPIGYSVHRSLFDASGGGFVGVDNYREVFTDDRIRTALRNNVIWVAVAPTVATALGLIFAVLTERVRWATAFKLVVFMPMAISMLAAGIIFRLVYEQDPDRGVANAVWVGVHDTFADPAPFPGAHPRPTGDLAASGGGAFTTKSAVRAGSPAALPLVAVKPEDVSGAKDAVPPREVAGKVTGTVWLDFAKGGDGTAGRVDKGEKALAGVRVEAVKDGRSVASTTSAADGTFTLPDAAAGARLRLPAANFAASYGGVDWLGPTLVTPAIIGSYIWMWAGFAMVLIAAGLAGVPRELLEAARVDGASEWQVFRRVTVPLLAPVLAVVVITLMINVLKIFDLVYIIAPGSSLDNANVLALQLYQSSFGTDVNQGVGSAIAVLLLLLVLPVMLVNIRRMRRERRR
ncbi:carbohydrate ABC transporter permease [Streptomyces netropsis]|uniref:Alpha-glucoside transport system permease protein n=1 Tax=Streptomyces netropsis TaxID=55404 RepID=A0A7W7PI47_STRNE|nr:sugar ABC transporter permease [Streptomyces netropsis]MBB4890657.1 alpha-glucoside transport system permease protein [Streptomyces netropsis]GGR49525.1 ABC transporter permease [Streptomyces netropsis]